MTQINFTALTVVSFCNLFSVPVTVNCQNGIRHVQSLVTSVIYMLRGVTVIHTHGNFLD